MVVNNQSDAVTPQDTSRHINDVLHSVLDNVNSETCSIDKKEVYHLAQELKQHRYLDASQLTPFKHDERISSLEEDRDFFQ